MMQSLELGGTGKTVALSFAVPAEVFDLVGAVATSRQPGRISVTVNRTPRTPSTSNPTGSTALRSGYRLPATMTDLVFFYGTLMSGFNATADRASTRS